MFFHVDTFNMCFLAGFFLVVVDYYRLATFDQGISWKEFVSMDIDIHLQSRIGKSAREYFTLAIHVAKCKSVHCYLYMYIYEFSVIFQAHLNT